MNRTKLKKLIKEVYYGSIPPEPELPVGYGGAMDRAKVQQHLSDEINELVRLGKLNIDDLSIETVRANQEIPWDKFQAIDDEVLGDIIRDYKRRQRFYKEGKESKLKQVIREELRMMTNDDNPHEFYRELYKTLYGQSPTVFPADKDLRAEIEALTFIEDADVEREKYWAEMDAVEAMPPDAGTETPLPAKFSGMGRRIKENKTIKKLVKEVMESTEDERNYDWSARSSEHRLYGDPKEALEEIKKLVDEVMSALENRKGR